MVDIAYIHFQSLFFYIRPLFYGCAVHNKELLLLVARNLLLVYVYRRKRASKNAKIFYSGTLRVVFSHKIQFF